MSYMFSYNDVKIENSHAGDVGWFKQVLMDGKEIQACPVYLDVMAHRV